MLNLFFPLYTLIWMCFTYFSGGYDRPLNLRKLTRGVLTGSAFILIVYSLLPEYIRFSRALILIGSCYTLLMYLLSRALYHLAGLNRFRIGATKKAIRMAIIGSESEFVRVQDIVQKTNIEAEFIGFVSPQTGTFHQSDHLGTLVQLEEIISVCQINELIFCAKDISSAIIIEKMNRLAASGLEFKIAAPESLSIIGSNSIDTAGDLYVADVNGIAKPENKRSKRLFDVLSSLFLLAFSWFLYPLQKKRSAYFGNCLKVLIGIYTWVGYGKAERRDLPAIRPSVLCPADAPDTNVTSAMQNRSILQLALPGTLKWAQEVLNFV